VIWVLLIALLILPGMAGCSYLPAGAVDEPAGEPGDKHPDYNCQDSTGDQDKR